MSESVALSVLLAPTGQLSSDGQLRESIEERRDRKGEASPIWYLNPDLVKKFELSDKRLEAVVAKDPEAIIWLKLRFGGTSCIALIDIDQLMEHASDLPPAPKNRDLSL